MELRIEPFIGCRAKIARAHSGAAELEELARTALRHGPQPSATLRKEDGWEVVRLNLPGFPAMLSVILGEVVHNLRSALDNVIWDAVTACGGVPGAKTAFPITNTAAIYERVVNPGQPKKGRRAQVSPLDGIPSSHAIRAVVKRHQPFETVGPGGEVRAEPLAILNAMWNVDKHRGILRPAVGGPPDENSIRSLFSWPGFQGVVEFQHPVNLINNHWLDDIDIARFRFPDDGLDPNGFRTQLSGSFAPWLMLGFDDFNGFGVEISPGYTRRLVSVVQTIVEEIIAAA